MRTLLVSLLLAVSSFAQSFPSQIYTPLVAKDNLSTTLNQAVGAGDTTVFVASTTGWAANMVGYVCDSNVAATKCPTTFEVMLVTAVTGANSLAVTRGYGGTTAITHASGRLFSNAQAAVYANSSQKELQAIETALGANLVNIPSGPFTNVSSYVFTPIVSGSGVTVSGGNLIIGNNTLTFAVVPKGINGSDANHELYVSGGTGTAGPCLINGGSGTAGQVNGQIIINCPATHSGLWQIATATGFIQEAIAGAVTGVVYAGPGTYTLNAAVQVPGGITLTGAGQGSTVLQVANNALTQTSAWQIPSQSNQNCIVCMTTGSAARLADFTVDANGANQTYFYYGDVYGYNMTNSVIERVTVKNHPQGGTGVTMEFIGETTANSDNLIIDSHTLPIVNCTVGGGTGGGGAYYLQGFGNRLLSSDAINYCDSPVVLDNCVGCVVDGNVMDLRTGTMGTAVYVCEDCTGSIISNNKSLATGTNYNQYAFGNISTRTGQPNAPTGNVWAGNSASHCFTGMLIGSNGGGSTSISSDILVADFHVENCAGIGVDIEKWSNKISVSNATLTGNGTAFSVGIATVSTGTQVVSNVSIDHVSIDHWNYGVQAINSSSGTVVNGLTIKDSWIGDTSGSPTQNYGLLFQTGLVSNVLISDNTFLGNTLAAALFSNSWSSNAIVDRNIGLAPLTWTAATLGSASTLGAGYQKYCTDCNAACVTGGPGNLAVSNGTAWECQNVALYGSTGLIFPSGTHEVVGSCTLGTSCAVTFTGAAVFTNPGSYFCTANDTTAAQAVKVNQTAGNAVTFTGTGTDVIGFRCVGY